MATFLVASMAMSHQAHAQSCESSGTWQRTNDENGNPSYTIYVYIEHDMHTELKNRSTTSTDNNLSFSQLRNAVMSAAEIWNNEVRAFNGSWFLTMPPRR